MPSTRLLSLFFTIGEYFDVDYHVLQNVYLLGTSLARPVIARGMIAIADKEGCE